MAEGGGPPSSPRTSPPKAVVDTSPIMIDQNKESLKVKLLLRRPFDQLVAQGIMPPHKTPAAFHGQRRQLERAKTGDMLKAKIQQRPPRQELERRHILEIDPSHVDPSIAERQRMLKKAKLADQLNDQLSHRPGPLELIQKNILHTEEPIEEAVKTGRIPYKATCEGQLHRPQLPSNYINPEEDSQSSEGDNRVSPSPSDVLETAAKSAGMFMCSSCKKSGQWNTYESTLSIKKSKKGRLKIDEETTTEVEKLKVALEEIRMSTSELNLLDEEQLHTVLKKFKLPVISNSTFESLNVRIDKNHMSLFFPLENVESEIVGYRKIHSRLNEDIVIPDPTYGGLMTGKAPKSKDLAVLVPSIPDFLVLVNSKVNANIVCLPNGVNNLSQYALPSLERFKKLVLWFASDSKSWNATRSFVKKLGEKRCQLVRPTDKHQLPHLDTTQDFKSIISGAQPLWHKSITTFASLRADVLSDLQNIDKVQGVKWKRFPGLNKTLKGHRTGELTVLTGPTGSGKTTFISEYSLDLAMQGVNTLWGSFEIRNARLAKTMLQQLSGIPLDENLHLFDMWADDFEKLPIYFMTFHGHQSIKVVMEAIEHAAYVYDISHVIIDNLQFMMGTSDEQKHMDRFWKQDAIIGAFREFATKKNCHVTLVIHPRKERDDEDLTTSSIFGGAKASQEADNILIIQDKRLSALRGKKYLQVVKNRYSGDLGIVPLDFDKSSLSFQQKKAKKTEGPPSAEVPSDRKSDKPLPNA